jgi:nucleoside-diphosphate-sugar epimerase
MTGNERGLDSGFKHPEEIIESDMKEIAAGVGELGNHVRGKKIVISGGAGFLGSYLSEAALRLGACVICVDTLISSSEKNISSLMGQKDFIFSDTPFEDYEIPENTDYIIHLASIASPPIYQKHFMELFKAGFSGTTKALEAARTGKNIKGVLIASSSEVYGDPPDDQIPTPESYWGNVSPIGPRATYDETKRLSETMASIYHDLYGDISVRIPRIFNTYGPKLDTGQNQSARALIKFVQQALEDKPITVFGDGTKTRSFCYVTDQTIGLLKLLLTPNVNSMCINIGNDQETSMLELVEKIVKISGSRSPIQLHAEPNYDIEDDPQRRCPDITLARKELCFDPKISLDEGLKRLIDWIRNGSK